jgi:hypothetical protein
MTRGMLARHVHHVIHEDYRPWPATGLTSATWRRIPVRRIALEGLILCQEAVNLEGVLRAAATGPAYLGHVGDPYPHVIAFDRRLWLEDGHCRVVAAIVQGQTTIEGRVFGPADQVEAAGPVVRDLSAWT